MQTLVARAGWDAATVASVAQQAGMSVGLVQHYFARKDDLLLFTYRQVRGDITARVARHIADGEARQHTIEAVVRESLGELLPLDAARRGEYRVTRAFFGRALDSPPLAEVATAAAAELRERLAVAVTNGTRCGEVAPETDAALAATRIAALVDGLADQLYQEPDRLVGTRPLRAAADHLLRSALAETFTGACHHYQNPPAGPGCDAAPATEGDGGPR